MTKYISYIVYTEYMCVYRSNEEEMKVAGELKIYTTEYLCVYILYYGRRQRGLRKKLWRVIFIERLEEERES
nr:hypothetical protein Itr_chr06CG02700 [Ipomoea trifida]